MRSVTQRFKAKAVSYTTGVPDNDSGQNFMLNRILVGKAGVAYIWKSLEPSPYIWMS